MQLDNRATSIKKLPNPLYRINRRKKQIVRFFIVKDLSPVRKIISELSVQVAD
jgi:hypothetical protein